LSPSHNDHWNNESYTAGSRPTPTQIGHTDITSGDDASYSYGYWDETDLIYYIYNQPTDTWYSLNPASAGDNTLDAAYDQGGAGAGRTITVDTGAVNLDGADADSAILTVSQQLSTTNDMVTLGMEHASSTGDLLKFTNAGSGKDASGTSDLWSLASDGALICVGVTDTGGITTDTSLATTGSGTLSVAGTTSLTGAVTTTAGLTVGNVLTVSAGGAAITGNSSITGNLQVSGTLTGTITFADANDLNIGTGNDLIIGSDGTDVFMHTGTAGTVLNFGSNEAGDTFNDLDINVYGSSGSSSIALDASADTVTFNGIDIYMDDDDNISFGDDQDIVILGSGTDLYIGGGAHDNQVHIGIDADTKNTNRIDLVWYGTAATNLITFDASADKIITTDIDLQFVDDDILEFGTGSDVVFMANGVDLYVGAAAHDNQIHFGIDADSKHTNRLDLVWYGTANTNLVTFDASADAIVTTDIDLIMADDDIIAFGTDSDVTISHVGGSTLTVLAAAADQAIVVGADGANELVLTWHGSTAGVDLIVDATNDLIKLDGFDLYLEDDDNISFGDSQDVVMQWAAGGGFNVTCAADDSVITMGADGANAFDLIWHGSTAGADIIIDASADALKLDGMDLTLEDGDLIVLGDDSDFTLTGTTNALSLYGIADTDVFTIGHQTAAAFEMDVQIRGSANANYVLVDASANLLSLANNFDLVLGPTSSPASGGAGVAGQVAWDADYFYVCTAANTWERVGLTGGY
jgi:hypothetical protein